MDALDVKLYTGQLVRFVTEASDESGLLRVKVGSLGRISSINADRRNISVALRDKECRILHPYDPSEWFRGPNKAHVPAQSVKLACHSQYCLKADTKIALKKCAICEVAAYCNADCQRQAWTDHKICECSALVHYRGLAKLSLYEATEMGNINKVRTLLAGGCDANQSTNEGSTPLHIAAGKGNLEIVECLVSHGANVNKATNYGETPLCAAVRKGHSTVMGHLVEVGKANINSKGLNSHHIPLHAAAKSGDHSAIVYLLQHGADIDICDDRGNTPLMVVAKNGFLEIIRTLVEAGSSINKANDTGGTPFHNACESGNLKIIKYLVECGANVRFTASSNAVMPPIYSAIRFNKIPVILYLYKLGIDVNDSVDVDGNSPLCAAIREAFYDELSIMMVSVLVERCGADVNKGNKQGVTPLHIAAQRGFSKIVDFLVSHGADVNRRTSNGETPYMAAVIYHHTFMLTQLQQLGAKAYDPEHAVYQTCLFKAAQNGDLSVVRCLVEHCDIKIDINEENELGETAVAMAVKSCKLGVVEYLHEHGANLQKRNTLGETLFMLAAVSGSTPIVEYLLQAGLVASDRDNNGRTALHAAVQKGHFEVVRCLVENGGADIHESVNRESFGVWTPLMLAAFHGHLEIVSYLVERGADMQIVGGIPEHAAVDWACMNEHTDVAEYLQAQMSALQVD